MSKKELIHKFFKQECSESELAILRTYLEEGFSKEVEEYIFDIWNEVCDDPNTSKLDVSAIKSQVLAQIKAGQSSIKLKATKSGRKEVLTRRRFLSIAASVGLLIGTTYLSLIGIKMLSNQTSTKLVWQEIETKAGERKELQLSDGTMIILNAKSYLRYPEKFGQSFREVFIRGEAYFEVKHDTGHPFRVNTEQASTLVLGTKFNVNAFEKDSILRVSLLKGKVEVSLQDETLLKNTILLKPKQEFVWNKNKEKPLLRKFDPYEVIGWKDNIFTFKKVGLEEVAQQVGQHFNRKIQITNEALKDYKIRGVYRGETAEKVLNVIFSASEDCLGLEQKNEILFIKKTKCN